MILYWGSPRSNSVKSRRVKSLTDCCQGPAHEQKAGGRVPCAPGHVVFLLLSLSPIWRVAQQPTARSLRWLVLPSTDVQARKKVVAVKRCRGHVMVVIGSHVTGTTDAVGLTHCLPYSILDPRTLLLFKEHLIEVCAKELITCLRRCRIGALKLWG